MCTPSFLKNTVLSTETQNDKLWVNLTDNEGYTAQLGLAFLQNATADFLIGEDVKTVNGRKYNFYTKSTNEDLIIDVQDAFNENKVIPLGITNTSENAQMMFTISIPKKEGVFNTQTFKLYLISRQFLRGRSFAVTLLLCRLQIQRCRGHILFCLYILRSFLHFHRVD